MFHVKHWGAAILTPHYHARVGHITGRLPSDSAKTQTHFVGSWAFGLAPVHPPLCVYPRAYALINPLPKISLELVTRMNALESADFRYSRRATAWERDRAVRITHLGSWE